MPCRCMRSVRGFTARGIVGSSVRLLLPAHYAAHSGRSRATAGLALARLSKARVLVRRPCRGLMRYGRCFAHQHASSGLPKGRRPAQERRQGCATHASTKACEQPSPATARSSARWVGRQRGYVPPRAPVGSKRRPSPPPWGGGRRSRRRSVSNGNASCDASTGGRVLVESKAS